MVDRKKAMIKQVQVLTGYLNFLTRAIFLGRTFTRRMYTKCAQMEEGKNQKKLRPHHHVKVDEEFKFDCQVWITFLTYFCDNAVCCPMVDLDKRTLHVDVLHLTSGASTNTNLGFGTMWNSGCLQSRSLDTLKVATPALNIWSYLPYWLLSSPGVSK